MILLGFGDTCASYFGIHYGKHHYSKTSSKTIEGTLAFIISSIIMFTNSVIIYNYYYNHTLVDIPWSKIIATSTITGLLEAYIEDIDNIILPLIAPICIVLF